MTDTIMKTYETLTPLEKTEVSDFIYFLVSKKNKQNQTSNIIRKFSGVIGTEDSKIMLNALTECRKVEPNSLICG